MTRAKIQLRVQEMPAKAERTGNDLLLIVLFSSIFSSKDNKSKERSIDKIEKLVEEHFKELIECVEQIDEKDRPAMRKLVDERIIKLKGSVSDLKRSNVSEKEASKVLAELEGAIAEMRSNIKSVLGT